MFLVCLAPTLFTNSVGFLAQPSWAPLRRPERRERQVLLGARFGSAKTRMEATAWRILETERQWFSPPPSLQGELINTWPTLHERAGSRVVWGASGLRLQSRNSVFLFQFVFALFVWSPKPPPPDWLTCKQQLWPWGTLFGHQWGIHYSFVTSA